MAALRIRRTVKAENRRESGAGLGRLHGRRSRKLLETTFQGYPSILFISRRAQTISMRKMTRLFRIYGKIARPWLTLIVYLWMLELLATFSTRDPEPLFDRIADCSAILAILAFWICAAVLLPSLIALFDNRRTILPLVRSRSKLRQFLSLLSILFAGFLIGRLYSALRTSFLTYCSVSACYWRYGVGSGSRIGPIDGWSSHVRTTVGSILRGHFASGDALLDDKGRQQLLVGVRRRRSFAHSSTRRPNVVLVTADAFVRKTCRYMVIIGRPRLSSTASPARATFILKCTLTVRRRGRA